MDESIHKPGDEIRINNLSALHKGQEGTIVDEIAGGWYQVDVGEEIPALIAPWMIADDCTCNPLTVTACPACREEMKRQLGGQIPF